MRSLTVITGGGRGIGAATARRLAKTGHDLVLGYRRDAESAGAVAEECRAAGAGTAVAVQVDTAVPESVAGLFRAAADVGRVTGLVNNAGVTSPIGRLADLPVDDLRHVMDVNVVGAFLCAQHAVRAMAGHGGAIVNVSSAASTLGSPGEYVHYAASKAAVDTLTIGLAKEVAADGIRVNAVQPGIIRTEIHAMSGDADRADRLGPTLPLGRAGEPDEVAAAIAWLLSPDASYTTGAIMRIAGGR